jgi:uncharacterized membrane protein YkvA (DUF1232 family)
LSKEYFMAFENYYEILGVDQKATPGEIKHAYRKMLSAWHPDHNLGRIAEAEEKTKILNQAYFVLSDPSRRKQYDRMLYYTRGKIHGKGIDEETFKTKVHRASPVMNTVIANVKDLYSMYMDALRRKYKVHPTTLGMIGAGLLYFIMPLDCIPDFTPFVGFLDDLAVITLIINTLQKELLAYRIWKKEASLDK